MEGHFSDLCQFHAMGEGFTWETQDRARDIAAARAGWEKAKSLTRPSPWFLNRALLIVR